MADVKMKDVAATFTISTVVGAIGYILYRLLSRDSGNGPVGGGWGAGFGQGTGKLNVNPLDIGKSGTGDGGGIDENRWERATVSGVAGWRRRGVPLPKEDGGPETYQAAVLILGDGDAIPDLSGWPVNLPVFFVHDGNAPYPEVDGGWMVDAVFGNRTEPKNRSVSCKATSSSELYKCVKAEIDNLLPGQWTS